MMQSTTLANSEIDPPVRQRAASKPATAPVESALRRRMEGGRKNLVPFFTAGFPNREVFLDLLRGAENIGCDAIEVGIPFSDPIADGPSIQYSNQQVLREGMSVAKALALIADSRIETPILIMGYLNPILAYGFGRFVSDARSAAVSGLIIPDLPLDAWSRAQRGMDTGCLSDELEMVLLVAPTTTDKRMSAIGGATRGFLYAVTVTGTTGARASLGPGVDSFLRNARSATRHPVLAGFGISNPKNARAIARHCDGVIVGSALIERIRNGSGSGAVRRACVLLSELRKVL